MTTPNKNYLLFSLIKIYFLVLLGGSYIHYGTNNSILRLTYYISLFLLFAFSKDKMFWLAFFFIIICHPFTLFKADSAKWVINLTSTVGIPYTFFFPIIIFLKYIKEIRNNKIQIQDYFRKRYILFFIYLFLLIFIGFLFGYDVVSIYFLILALPVLILFFVLPRLFIKTDEMINFDKLIFLFSLTHSIVSFIDIAYFGAVTNLLTFGQGFSVGAFFQEDLVRLTGNITIALYVIFKVAYYLLNRNLRFNQNYLWVLIFISTLYIFSSATRGWMIASGFFLIIFLFISIKSLKINPSLVFSGIFIFILMLLILPNSIARNLNSSFERFSTLALLLKDDESAGGSLQRITDRGPRVLSKFNESPIFGFGFSKITREYYDGHVGNQSILLQSGVIGFSIVWGTILLILFDLKSISSVSNRKGIILFAAAILSIMIIHSSSRAMVGFYFPVDSAIIFGLLFNHTNIILYEEREKNIDE